MLSEESEEIKLVIHEDIALIQIILARASNKVCSPSLKNCLLQAKEIIDSLYIQTDVLPF